MIRIRKTSFATIVSCLALSAALALTAEAQPSATAQSFRLKAFSGSDKDLGKRQFIGYKHADVKENGDAPASLVAEADLARNSTAFEFTKVQYDDETFAFRIDNYPASAGVDTSKMDAYLVSYDDGRLNAKYLPKDKGKYARSQFGLANKGPEGYDSYLSLFKSLGFLTHNDSKILLTMNDGAEKSQEATYWNVDPIMTSTYAVQVQWGDKSSKWVDQGTWKMGSEPGLQHLTLTSGDGKTKHDGGKTFAGQVKYDPKKGMKDIRGNRLEGNRFAVDSKWGQTPWHNVGTWVIGNRKDQGVIDLKLTSDDGGKTLNGTMTYAGEKLISVKAVLKE